MAGFKQGFAIALAAFGAAALSGCCAHRHTSLRNCGNAYADYGGGPHLIFNPDSANLGLVEFVREDWPFAVASDWPVESVSYREVIHDYQGRFGRFDDGYVRRFDSHRVGYFRR